MLQLSNTTPFKATLLPLPDAAGLDSLFAVVKGTFSLGPKTVLAENQVPIQFADEYAGAPGQSSILAASDTALLKPGTDVLVRGHAYPTGGRTAARTSVSLSAGSINKRAEVFGDRVWEGGLLSPRASPPKPFDRIPLVWERAFGGVDSVDGTSTIFESEERNPVGIGFRSRKSARKVEGSRLPNLEDPKHLISSPKDRPPPIGFGPVGPHWLPRKSYAGTYDERWQRERAPFLPADFDSRFFQLAPADQIMPGYFLQGGEVVRITGTTPSGTLSFTVPSIAITITYHLDGIAHNRVATLDTLVVEPDDGHFVLVWRSGLTCDKKVLTIRKVEITAEKGAA